MGIFDRIKNGVRGTAEGVVRGMEERNPEAVYDAAIEGRQARTAELKERAAALVVQRDREAERIGGLEREAVRLAEGLRGALAEDDDDTALVLQVRRQEVDDELEKRRVTLVDIEAQVEEIKAGLVAAGQDTKALKHEKDVQLAQKAVASAAIEIHEATSGVSDAPTARALDSVRESIGILEGRAHEGWLDEDGNSVRGRAQALGRKASEQSARDQLEVLKRQLGKAPPEDDDDGEP